MRSTSAALIHAARRVQAEQLHQTPKAFFLRNEVGHVLSEGQIHLAITEAEEIELLGFSMALRDCLEHGYDIDTESEAHVRARLAAIGARLPVHCDYCTGQARGRAIYHGRDLHPQIECSICRRVHGLETLHARE